MDTHDRIFVAGHKGLVGSALVRQLGANGFQQILTRSRQELDLTEQAAVRRFFSDEKIDAVFLAAGRVGGVNANNTFRADFIYENLMIAANVIHHAYAAGVRRLLFLGSSCIYPRAVAQPMREEALLTGTLEPTNEPYAIAKISGVKMCEAYNAQYRAAYRAVMPTNLFGPNDNYDLEKSHVLPAIIRKLHLAKSACAGAVDTILNDQQAHGRIPDDVRACLDALLTDNGHLALFKTDGDNRPQQPGVTMWGSGKPLREFLHVDDMAAACLFTMQLEDDVFTQMMVDDGISFLNVGAGREISIYDLVNLVTNVVGYEGNILWDDSKPDGISRKLLDTTRLAQLGWRPAISLEEGIRRVYQDYCG
ncbi:MAG: GDP-L-fucose synthase [Desulfobacterales bacterium]|nr:GDP-L-fucose synthase [Desulfobacterales bacterium]